MSEVTLHESSLIYCKECKIIHIAKLPCPKCQQKKIEQLKEELHWIDVHIFQKSVDTQATKDFIKEDTIEAKRILRICELIEAEQAQKGGESNE